MKKTSEKKQPLKPEQLGELYPTPKTYDEIQADTEARQERFDTLRTKFAAFKIAFFGSLLFAATAYYASSVETLWMIPDVAIIAFSYAVWVILLLFAIKWFRYTTNIFYEYSSHMLAFWIVYGIVMGAALFAWKQGLWVSHTDYRWIGILTAAHVTVTYLGAKIFIKK